MGYYTTFNIDVRGEHDVEEIREELSEISDYSFEIEDDCLQTYEIKWYKHNDNLTTLSKRYPNNLFIVDGDGEESDDFWRKYYYNGKVDSVQAEIRYAESDLQEEFEANEAIDKMLTGKK